MGPWMIPYRDSDDEKKEQPMHKQTENVAPFAIEATIIY